MIKRLTLYNFKSIARVEIDFDPLTVLIGKSGTGKTNIVDGIRFWRDLLTRLRNPPQANFVSVLSAGALDKPFGIQIELGVQGTAETLAYAIDYKLNPNNPTHAMLQSESLRYGGRLVFQQEANRWLHPPDVMQPPPPGQPALGSIYGIPEVKLAHLALTQGIGCYDFPGTVLTSSDAVSKMDRQGLADHAENYLAVYETLGNAIGSVQAREVIAALKALNSTIATLDLETQQRNKIFVGQRTLKGKALTLELAQQSEGFRRFLAHLLALYQIPSKPTLIFEEAEKGIYPGALAALADHFNSVAERGDSQVIVTTHSPQLLDHFAVDSIRVVEMEDYQTKVGRLSPEQVEAIRDSLLATGELLTADPARVAEQV